MQPFIGLHPSTTRSNFTQTGTCRGEAPPSCYARPFCRLKAPLGLSLLHFAAQTRTTLFLLCTKSYIVWRKIGVWRSFRWKFVKRKSLKLLGTSRSFRLCYLKIGNLLLNRLHRGDTFRNRLTMLRDASQSRFHLRSQYSQSFVIRRHSRSFAVNLLSLEEFCCQTKRSVRALLCYQKISSVAAKRSNDSCFFSSVASA